MGRASRSALRALVGALVLGGGLAAGGTARAEVPRPKSTDPVPSPGRAIASDDDATAVAVNPANLAFLPDPELRWTWVWLDEQSPKPNRGHAVDLAAPFWIFGTGARVDFLDPRGAAPPPFDAPYQWIRWGLAVRAGNVASFGTSLAWSLSTDDDLDDQFALTSGLTIRPLPYVSFAAVARDWNLPVAASGARTERSYDLGLALRPTGRRGLEIGGEATYYESQEEWVPKGTLGLDVPYVGRIRGEVSVASPEDAPRWTAAAGLDINLGYEQVAAGAYFGDGLRRAGTDLGGGFYAGLAVRAYREPGVPLPARVAKVRIDKTPGVRGHTKLLRRLWRLADDPEVEGVVLVIRDEPASSLAHAEEVGDAIRTVRARGKKVLCHLEDAGGKSLHVCSQADRIAINPAGGLRFAGLSSKYFYFHDLLQKLGVRADFVRIGDHKSAAEQFTTSQGTPIARQDHEDLVRQYEKVLLNDVGGGRRIPVDELKRRIAKGPFLASEAKEAGLVDVLAFDDEIPRVAEELFGRPVLLADDEGADGAPQRWSDAPKVAIVYLAGDMIDGESQNIPFVGIKLAGSYTLQKALRRAREDESIRAVVFRVETGGGSSLAADVILREAMLTAKTKPFVVSMGTSAASGGYYASMTGSPIYANRSTVTGSIGIFYGKVDVQGLLEKFGVHVESFRSSPRADAESLFRPFTDDEHRELGVKVKQFYDLFVGRVAEGRKLAPEAVDAVARGRVWTGEQALQRRLVDKMGGLREAIKTARGAARLPPDSPIVELPDDDESLLGMLLQLAGAPSIGAVPMSAFVVPPALLDVARVAAPFLSFEPGKPLARVEYFEDVSFGRPSAALDDP